MCLYMNRHTERSPALDLPGAPEEDAAALAVDRGDEADDSERAARPGVALIGDRQPHPVGARIGPLHPVEIDAALVGLLEHQPVLGVADAHPRVLVAAPHRMRFGVQVGAVHGVHHVVDGVAVVAAPVRGAEDRAPLLRAQLLGIFERHRLGMQRIAEIGEDAAHVLEGGVGLHRPGADQRAVADRRHRDHGAGAVDLQPVIPAGQPVAEIPALRELRAAMRAAVGKHVHAALAVAPDHDALAEPHQRDRPVADHPARGDRVPAVANAEIDQGLDFASVLGHSHLHRAARAHLHRAARAHLHRAARGRAAPSPPRICPRSIAPRPPARAPRR